MRETILARTNFTELLELIVSLGEVGGPVGEVEDGKDERKKVSGDHINTLAAVYRELASGSEAATAATRFLVPVLMVLQPLEVAGVFQEGIL